MTEEEKLFLLLSQFEISNKKVEKILDDAILLKEGKVEMFKSVDDIRTEYGKSVDELFREVFQCSQSY